MAIACNVARNEGFEQVCIWPGIILEPGQRTAFSELMLDLFDVRVQFLEEVETLPDRFPNGLYDTETGGRNDIVFAVHNDDVGKFAVPRLKAGIRWVEDALGSWNHSSHLYPERFSEYKTWNTEPVDA
jgi:hypothetical protein